MSEWNDHWMDASAYGTLKLDDDQPNRPPEVIQTINELQILQLNIPYIAVTNLNEIFLDPDGDQLIYSGSTNDTRLTVGIQDDTVVVVNLIDFLDDEVVVVTIMANDGDSYVSTQFTVHGIVDNVKELSAESFITINPNPSNSNLSIKIDNNILGLVEIQVMDLSGKLITENLEFKVSQVEEYSVDLNDLDPGLYLVQIKQGTYNTIKKIVHQ